MEKDIYNFHKQLEESFEIVNESKWKPHCQYIVSGMGGSHLQADILKAFFPELPILIHSDYGLPSLFSKKAGFVAVSYSGNTEEVLDSLKEAIKKKMPVFVISKGGALIEKAKEEGFPFIKLPENDIQPRLGIGYSFKALLKCFFLEKAEKDCLSLANNILEKRDFLKEKAQKIASLIEEGVPIIYASAQNEILARVFKINFNETTKIPSFYNTLPELNHNEMTGFDIKPINRHLSSNMIFTFLRDKDDHQRVQKRFDVLKEVLEKRDMKIIEIDIEGETKLDKLFSSVILSAWISYYLSFYYKTEPSSVPMVEEFKKLIK